MECKVVGKVAAARWWREWWVVRSFWFGCLWTLVPCLRKRALRVVGIWLGASENFRSYTQVCGYPYMCFWTGATLDQQVFLMTFLVLMVLYCTPSFRSNDIHLYYMSKWMLTRHTHTPCFRAMSLPFHCQKALGTLPAHTSLQTLPCESTGCWYCSWIVHSRASQGVLLVR